MKTLIKSIIIICSGILLSCYDSNNSQTPLEPSEIYSNIDEISFSYKDFTYESYSSSMRENAYRNNFIGILNRLNLDSLQRIEINKLLFKHRECTNLCVSEFKKKEKEILDSARIEFRDIRFNTTTGIITKEQARELTKALNNRIKDSIRVLQTMFNIKGCLAECDKTFIESLLKILKPEQADKFNEMIKQRRSRLGETKKDSIDIKRDTIRIKKDSIDIKRDTTHKKRKIG